MNIKIPRAYIEAMPANLIEGKVKLTFSIPLNDETMQLRDWIAAVKSLDTAVVLDITSPQGMLPSPGLANESFDANPDWKPRVESITLSSGDKSVTLDREQFSKAARRIRGETSAALARTRKNARQRRK